jgi:hypothetical protein
MQQWQVNFQSIFAPDYWSKWLVPEKWSIQWGFEPTTSHESSALTTRLRLLAKSLLKVCFYIIAIHFEKLGIWLVVVDRWLLFRGGRQHRFDCIVFCKNKIFAKFLRDNCQL